MGVSCSIAVGVITCGRPKQLRRLLVSLAHQKLCSDLAARLRVIVVDNGRGGESRQVVEGVRCETDLPIQFVAEPEPGIPFARNACVRAAMGDDVLVFIDDDEWAPEGWLDSLVRTWKETGADIVTGPVRAVLPEGAPAWARQSGIFDKPRGCKTGEPVNTAFTYNALVSARVLRTLGPSFHPVFRHTGSSDYHYFRKAALAGFTTVWCEEAVVYEEVPAERLRLAWVLRRGYRIGAGGAAALRMLEPSGIVLLRIAARAGGHGGAGVLHLARALRQPRREGVRALWRLAIMAGFVLGPFGLRYEEYAPRGQRDVDRTQRRSEGGGEHAGPVE